MKASQRGAKAIMSLQRRWPWAMTTAAVVLLVGGCGGRFADSRGGTGASAIKEQVWGSQGSAPGQFNGPRAITAAPDGYVYVADRASRVTKFRKNGQFVSFWVAPVVHNGRFEGPEGITHLPDGDIAMTNTHASRVLVYSPKGVLKQSFGSYGYAPGQLMLVTGICADSGGDIYTSDYDGAFDRITRWNKAGRVVACWSGHGEAARQFRRPTGLAISRAGDLLVADSCNHRIQILDRFTGAYKGVIGGPGRGNGQFTYPFGVAVDGRGRIYTVEYGTHRVQQWDEKGHWMATWGGPGRTIGHLANPWGLAVDPDGTVYVADTNNNRVQKFRFPDSQGPEPARMAGAKTSAAGTEKAPVP